ncbi:MAG: hypothetical protein ABI806_29450 [Candidatus Solibacter sp.]
MRLIIGLLLAALACFGQAKSNVVETGLRDASVATWIPPTCTFAAPPSSPPTGAVCTFTDASSSGAATGGGTYKSVLRYSGSAWVATALSGAGAITFVAGDGTAALTTGSAVCGEAPYAATITGWRIRSLNGTSGSVIFAITVNGASIVAAAPPTLTTATSASGSVSTWANSNAIAVNDLLCFTVSSVTSITNAQLTLSVVR